MGQEPVFLQELLKKIILLEIYRLKKELVCRCSQQLPILMKNTLKTHFNLYLKDGKANQT
jgi:hypothetical protein